MESSSPDHQPSSYAIGVAAASHGWYVEAAKRSRRMHRGSEIGTVVLSASIPVVAVLAPGVPAITAMLGGALVVITGFRGVFKWQENYFRFSQAREAVEQQRRLYIVGAAPYNDAETRDHELVQAVSRIERDEMGEWVQITHTTTPAERPAEN
ncbi:MAG: DUF4231 domain-containing protein [Actinoplanes sp.]